MDYMSMNATMKPAETEKTDTEIIEETKPVTFTEDELLDQYKSKYGEVWEIEATVGGDDEVEGEEIRLFFTRPSTASFNRYMKTASKNMSSATTVFVRDNLVAEQTRQFDEYCTKYPGLALGVGNKLLNIIGLGDNINFRKL